MARDILENQNRHSVQAVPDAMQKRLLTRRSVVQGLLSGADGVPIAFFLTGVTASTRGPTGIVRAVPSG